MDVKMLVNTGRDGKKINPGDVINVPEATALFWEKHGLAKIIETTEKPKVNKKSKKVKNDGADSGNGHILDASRSDDICNTELCDYIEPSDRMDSAIE